MEQQQFWLGGDTQVHPVLRGRQMADAVVIGGGFAGITSAVWLGRAGLRVMLLEAETLGCGASSRCLGKVSLQGGVSYYELEKQFGREFAAAYGMSQQNAFAALKESASMPGANFGWLEADDYLTCDEKTAPLMQKELESMKKAGIAAQMEKATQSPLPADYALCIRNMALLHPARYLRRLIRLGEKNGVRFFEHSRVVAMESNLAITDHGSVQAPYIVVATGYPVVNIPGWYFLRLVQKQGWLLPTGGAPGFTGIYGDYAGRYTIRPLGKSMLLQLNGGKVGVKKEDPLEIYRTQYRPWLDNAPVQQVYGGVDTFTPDGLPCIGPYGGKTPNMFVACGFGGRGLLGSMLAAQSISARVLGLSNDGDSIYSGQRSGKTEKWLQIRAGLGIAGQYAKGALRLNSPRCPHMGCKLRYRREERMWECPCHGSRFDDIGHIKNAPSVRDAEILRRRKGP